MNRFDVADDGVAFGVGFDDVTRDFVVVGQNVGDAIKPVLIVGQPIFIAEEVISESDEIVAGGFCDFKAMTIQRGSRKMLPA